MFSCNDTDMKGGKQTQKFLNVSNENEHLPILYKIECIFLMQKEQKYVPASTHAGILIDLS